MKTWRTKQPVTGSQAIVVCEETGEEAFAHVAWDNGRPTLIGRPYTLGEARKTEECFTDHYPLDGEHRYA